MNKITESSSEQFAIELLEESVYQYIYGPDIAPDLLSYAGQEGETVWLTQKAMADLFGVKVPSINKHLKNIFESGELQENSAISILETVQS